MRNELEWPLLLDGPKLPGDPDTVLKSDRPMAARIEALQQLAGAAARGDPSIVNRYAAGLLALGRRYDAERVWRQLLERHPGMTLARVNLASCQLEKGQLEECVRVLHECRDRTDSDTPERRLVEKRIAELEQARQWSARQERFLRLRVAALREREERGVADVGDLKDLARALYGLTQVPDSGVTGRDVREAAQKAYDAASGDVEALEILVLGLLCYGSNSERASALRELEKKARHSEVLALHREMRTDTSLQERSNVRGARMDEVAERAFAGDRNAEAELRLEIQRFPANQRYRVDLLFAVYNRGDYGEASRLADELAADPSAGHLVHFHVAQFYWLLGQRKLSRYHFARAWETAVGKADWDDVREAMRTVGAGSPEDLGLG